LQLRSSFGWSLSHLVALLRQQLLAASLRGQAPPKVVSQ
jgi:hypothetical protein